MPESTNTHTYDNSAAMQELPIKILTSMTSESLCLNFQLRLSLNLTIKVDLLNEIKRINKNKLTILQSFKDQKHVLILDLHFFKVFNLLARKL